MWKTGWRWASLLPLICWQGLEDGNKGVSAEIPEPIAATPRRADSTTSDLSCHSKESWLDHFGLINKFLLPLKSCHHQQNNNARWPTTSEDQWTRNHAGPMVVTISLLLPAKIPCFYFLPFLSLFFPSPSPWMTRICNNLVGPTFEPLFLNLTSGIHISKNLLSLL